MAIVQTSIRETPSDTNYHESSHTQTSNSISTRTSYYTTVSAQSGLQESQNIPSSLNGSTSSPLTNIDHSPETIYVTAETSLEPLSETQQASFENSDVADVIIPNDSLLDNSPEPSAFDELAHKPPFIPSIRGFATFGKSTLRQAVISRQSSRLGPPQDHLIEHMEEQLVRWRAPQSSSKVDEIINCKHVFQQQNLPMLELSTTLNEPIESTTISTDNNTTDSTVKSIARSPYVSMSILQHSPPIHRSRVTFHEHVDMLATDTNKVTQSALRSITDDQDSIQDSACFNTVVEDNTGNPDQDSPSISSSMMAELTGEINGTHEKDTSTPIASPQENTVSQQLTPDAIAITEGDVPFIIKDQPQLREMFQMNGIHANPGNFNFPSDDDEEKDCWNITKEVFEDMWLDFVDLCTCQCPSTYDRDN